MSEAKELKKELTKEVLDIIRDGKDFVKEQAPELAKDTIGEGVFDAKFGLIIGGILLLAAIIMLNIGILQPLKSYGSLTDLAFAMYLLSGIAGVIGIAFFICNFYSLMIIKKFPKLYLYRKLR